MSKTRKRLLHEHMLFKILGLWELRLDCITPNDIKSDVRILQFVKMKSMKMIKNYYHEKNKTISKIIHFVIFPTKLFCVAKILSTKYPHFCLKILFLTAVCFI